jgi:hypothetical protein
MSRQALDLPGWDHHSVYGWDDGIGSYFAQLYRNGDPLDEFDSPTVWLSGVDRVYRTQQVLARAIAQAAGMPLAEVQAAMARAPLPTEQ